MNKKCIADAAAISCVPCMCTETVTLVALTLGS